MKWWRIIIVGSLVAAFMQCATISLDNLDRIRAIDSLNLRKDPSLNANIVAKVSAGDELYLLDAKNDWYEVQNNSGDKGWVYRGFTNPVKPQEVIVKKRTYLYRGPSRNYETFAILMEGRVFTLQRQQGDWYLVNLPDGNAGWISKDDAEIVKEQEVAGTTGETYHLIVPLEAHIRTGPGTKYHIIETLGNNAPLIILNEKDGWYYVKTPTGKKGWVFSGVVQKTSDFSLSSPTLTSQAPLYSTQAAAAPVVSEPSYAVHAAYLMTNTDCNIRQGFSTDFPVLTRLKKNAVVLKIGAKDEWVRIKYPPNGDVGWIHRDLLINPAAIYVTNQDCNIRQGYSTSFEVKMRAPAGTPLAQIETQADWRRVYMPEGDIGWIQGELAIPAANVLVANQDCNIRSGPGIDNKQLGRLQTGTIVERLNVEGEWYQIRTPNQETGWVRNDLVATIDDQFVVNQEANIRQEATTTSAVVQKVSNGTRLYLIAAENNWAEVRIATGGKGWIHEDLVLPTYYSGAKSEVYKFSGSSTTPMAVSQQVVPSGDPGRLITTEPLTNIRIGPGLEYSVLVQVERGTELIKLSLEGDWYRVKLPDGQTGYVSRSIFTGGSSSQAVDQNVLYAINDTKIYADALENSRVVETIPKATAVTKLDQRDKWIRVKLRNTQDGWALANAFQTYAQAQKTVSKSELQLSYGHLLVKKPATVRTDAGLMATKISTIPANKTVTKFGKLGDWFMIDAGADKIGYVQASDVQDNSYAPVITTNPGKIIFSPNNPDKVIEEVPIGVELNPMGESADYLAVETSTGAPGWINKSYVQPLQMAKVFAAGGAKLRIYPSLKASDVLNLDEGAELIPRADFKNWLFVTAPNGETGWIPQSLVIRQKYPEVSIKENTHALSAPSTTAGDIAMLRKDDTFIPAEKEGGWYKLFLKTGGFGWIYKTFVEEMTEGKLLVKQDSPIREGAGNAYKIMKYVKAGTDLICFQKNDNWCQVQAPGGNIGWIVSEETKHLVFSEMRTKQRTAVRSGAGTQFAELKELAPNQTFKPVDEMNGWYKVVLDDGRQGYVLKSQAEPKSKSRTVFTLDLCNIRSGPSTTDEVIARVDPATDLIVIGEQGDWYNIEVTSRSNTRGWIRKDLVFE
ncbi:SH3 domain-containing protein [candidate division KSB1 bacterium]|nr:SH3 domain-containing protein [candidate division KSB1 bacterium]